MAFITYDGCVALGLHLKIRNGCCCWICGVRSSSSVTRYVITRKGADDPERTLAEPAQGYYTYPTAQEARARLDEIRENANGDQNVIEEHYPNAEVRPVECRPDNFDPKTRWFD